MTDAHLPRQEAANRATDAQDIAIFRAGDFVSVEGVALSFGQAELAQLAASYDAKADPAPLVIGHPKLADPAYGWVGALRIDNGILMASPDRVEPSFAEMVREGRFAKVSAQLYPPAHGANPKPGQWYLKHVGFLGAAAPAVKGLGIVSLSDGEGLGDMATVEFARQDFFQQEEVVSMSEQDAIKKEDETAKLASFAEREAELATREAELAAREDKARSDAASARHESHVSFAEGLVAEGKLAPAGKQLVIGLMDQLGGDDRAVSFAEAGEMQPVAALRALFDKAQPLVSFAELAAPDGAKPISDDPDEIAARALSFAEKNGVNIAVAVRRVMQEGI